MAASRLDQLYRSLLVTKFYTKGWGQPDDLKRIIEFRKLVSNREICSKLVACDYPVTIHKESLSAGCRVLDGSFVSPFVHLMPGLMPAEVQTARFQAVLPLQWTDRRRKAVCLQLAGTGDHGFWRRRTFMARPLIAEAEIGSILLENPYYGVRKPRQQLRSSLQNVADLFIMGAALVLESAVLLHWCRRQGLGPLGITGVSMGGYMASLAATNWPEPIAIVPCLSWSTASSVWTQGVLSAAVAWGRLQQQYSAQPSYAADVAKMLSANRWIQREKAERLLLRADSSPTVQQQFGVGRDGGRARQRRGGGSPSPASAAGSAAAAQHQWPTAAAAAAGFSPSLLLATDRSSSSDSLASAREHPPRPPSSSGGMLTILLQLRQRRQPPSGEVVEFMRGLMDECTHLGHYSVPVDPSLAIVVAARRDAYVPHDGVTRLDEIWPGCQVRFVDSGHVPAVLLHQADFRSAIVDSFDLLQSKYGPS